MDNIRNEPTAVEEGFDRRMIYLIAFAIISAFSIFVIVFALSRSFLIAGMSASAVWVLFGISAGCFGSCGDAGGQK